MKLTHASGAITGCPVPVGAIRSSRPVLKSRVPAQPVMNVAAGHSTKPSPMLRTSGSVPLRARGWVVAVLSSASSHSAAMRECVHTHALLHTHTHKHTRSCHTRSHLQRAHTRTRTHPHTTPTHQHRLASSQRSSFSSGSTALRPSTQPSKSGSRVPCIRGAVCRQGGRTIICAVLVSGWACGC